MTVVVPWQLGPRPYSDLEARQALEADQRPRPNGHEREGEHWNARLLRQAAIRKDIAVRYFSGPEDVQ